MPATGIMSPHNRFWMAIANAKVSRSHPIAPVMGVRNRPNVDRTPKPTMQIKQPATITIAGVLHLEVTESRSIPFMGSSKVKELLKTSYCWIVIDLLLLLDYDWKIKQRGQTGDITVPSEPEL